MPEKPQKAQDKRKGEFPSKEHQFKPGNRANPGGRPKGQSMTAMLRKFLDTEVPGDKKKTYGEMVVKALVTKAMSGNPQCLSLILDRVDGKVMQPVALSGADPNTLAGTRDEDLAAALGIDRLGSPARAPADPRSDT